LKIAGLDLLNPVLHSESWTLFGSDQEAINVLFWWKK